MTDTLNPSLDTPRISWAAVWAGVFAALAVQILLIMLGIGVGAISIDLPSVSGPPGLRWAAFGWWAVGGIIAAFVGGWLAGLLSDSLAGGRWWAGGALHGFLAWAVAMVIVVGAAGIAAGTTATVVGSLAGPTIATRADLQQAATNIAAGRQSETPGAPAVSATTAAVPSADQLRAAQGTFGNAMLGSFIALLLGAIAASLGGRMAQGMRRLSLTT